eukprot:1855664-Prymnesium_polylepis.1
MRPAPTRSARACWRGAALSAGYRRAVALHGACRGSASGAQRAAIHKRRRGTASCSHNGACTPLHKRYAGVMDDRTQAATKGSKNDYRETRPGTSSVSRQVGSGLRERNVPACRCAARVSGCCGLRVRSSTDARRDPTTVKSVRMPCQASGEL